MKRNIFLKLSFIGLIALASSCSQYKKFNYLQDVSDFEQMQITQVAQVKARKGDHINIYVSSRNAESAAPFNLTAQGYRPGNANSEMFTSNTSQRSLGYHVDEAGNIEFPQIGSIHVDGLTRAEITEVVKNKLIQNGYLKDPIVTVDFQDLRVTVMGEVARAGSYSMNNDHTTLLEALALAGDLTPYGRRDRVAVIREINGERSVMWHDIRSKALFESPRYYLQQNDIIYVEPNRYKADQSTQSRWNQPSVWISILSTCVSVATLIRLLVKD